MVGIYGLRNRINDKWYVGQSRDIHKRWSKAYRNANCKNQRKLYRALKKYGYDAFDKVVLEECELIDWILDYREMYWIRHYNSVVCGYNVKSSSQRHSWSEESRTKLKNCNKGKKRTRESIEKAKATFIKNGHSWSHPHTEETKQRLREKAIGRKHTELTKVKMSMSHPKIGVGPKHTEATKDKLRSIAITQFQSEESRQRVREQTSLRWKDPAFRQKVIDGVKRSQKKMVGPAGLEPTQ